MPRFAGCSSALFFALTCVVGVVGYLIAGWSLLDAIYMVVITVFSVGYGEVRTLQDPGLKIFTIWIIIAGCSSGIYVVGGFVSMIAEGEINKALGGRRMTKEIEKLSNHTIICGYGRVGQMLAKDLEKANQPFVVIDSNEGRVQSANGRLLCPARLGLGRSNARGRRNRPRGCWPRSCRTTLPTSSLRSARAN